MITESTDRNVGVNTRAVTAELRRLRWALALICGLVGALAVHFIFCQTFLPGLTSDTTSLKAVTAFSDTLGGLVFLVLAAPNLRIGG